MKYKNSKLLGRKELLVSQEAFIYYRDNSKKRNKKLTSERKDFAKILNGIYREVRESAIEYEGGVYAPNFFYIIPQPYPKKRFIKILQKGGEFKGTLNLHTKGKVYTLLFINLLQGRQSKMWDMSGAFFRNIKERLSKKLKEGNVRYIFCLDTLKKVR